MENIITTAMSGVGISSTPLISFDTIIDIDLSLVSYCIKNFRNPEFFRLDEIKNMKITDIIKGLYFRRYKNPLYFLSNSEEHYEFLDQCYEDFMMKELFLDQFAIQTDVYNMVQQFVNSGEISTTILYKTEKEKDIIERDELLGKLDAISADNVDMNSFTQVYLKYVEDAEPYCKIYGRTFYISSVALNMNEDSTDIKDSEIINELARWHNEVSVFTLYKDTTIGRSMF